MQLFPATQLLLTCLLWVITWGGEGAEGHDAVELSAFRGPCPMCSDQDGWAVLERLTCLGLTEHCASRREKHQTNN